jgi:hypothetical protein
VTLFKELSKYKFHLVRVQVRREGGGTKLEELTFFYEKWSENHELGTGFFVHKRIILALKRGWVC